MVKQYTHTRILSFPEGQSPAGGRLEALNVQTHGGQIDILLDYLELQKTVAPVLFERDGRPWELVKGIYRPHRLQFSGVQITNGGELPGRLNEMPVDAPTRCLSMAFTFRTPEDKYYFIFITHTEGAQGLVFTAQKCTALERSDPIQTVSLSRDWSPAPANPTRLVPKPTRLHQRFGGDPIGIRLKGRIHRQRLFIGGVDIQSDRRPDIHSILNVGEKASRWTSDTPAPATDRWDNKGEGTLGMDVGTIRSEASWVIERLRAGQRVLVHCAAGMNRSSTICCAVLILLEGLPAEAALKRVREQHPWALPDSHHWLALRWLAHTNNRQ